MIRFLAVFAVAALVATPALAQRSVVTEMQYFKDVNVQFSDNAGVCGFNDPKPYQELVAKRMAELDIPQNPDAITSVDVSITASAAGLLQQQCVAYIQLGLSAKLASEFLDAAAIGGTDQIFVTLSQRKYIFPVLFYRRGALFRALQPDMVDRSLKTLNTLVDHLAESRKLR